MSKRLIVIMGNHVAGTVEMLSDGKLRFVYDEAFRSLPTPRPLSLSMPVQIAVHPDHVISPWLWGLLPDNERVLARWTRQFHVAHSAFSLLSTQVGEDCAGAVRFAKPEDFDRVMSRSESIHWLSQGDIAQRLRELREDSTSWLGRDFSGQFSLAGAQAKTALLNQDGRWGEPTGSTATTHIIKPAVSGFDDHDLNEHLCLDAARRAGLTAVRSTIERFDGESAVVVERYDRVIQDAAVVRVHQEDLCQALSIPPSKKYQNEGGPSPQRIVKVLRSAMPPRVADDAVRRFADALIWNWFIAGTDGHAKNYSVLLSGNQVRLAPLYDVASALPYGIHERKLRLAMKIGGDYRVYPERNNWPTAAKELGVDATDLIDRVRELGARVPDCFSDAVRALDGQSLSRSMPTLLVDLVTKRAHRCVSMIDGGKTVNRAGGSSPAT